MTVDELIQLIRTCNLSQVRTALEKVKKNNPNVFIEVEAFFTLAAKQK